MIQCEIDSSSPLFLFSHGKRYALIHPEAINCVNPDGTTYNRVEMLQNQGYYVQIAGQAITNVSLNTDI